MNSGVFDTSIRSWLSAMQKADKIKPGGKLLFVNKRTGNVVSAMQTIPNAGNLETGAAGQQKIRSVDPVGELRQKGMVLGRSKRGRRG